MKKKLNNWVESFYEYTEFLPSPDLFRKWAGIAAVAGALERKVWTYTVGSRTYPNLYTVLVSPPGVGKSVLTSRIEALWHSLAGHHVAPTNITKPALVDELYEASRSIARPNETPNAVHFNSLKILSNELGVLLPQYDTEFMATLTDIYDGSPYRERRRSRKEGAQNIDHPQLNLLTGTTPSHLSEFLPAGAFDQGFMSRCLLIYAGDTKIIDLFAEIPADTADWATLKVDLKKIGNMYGEMKFTPEAKEAIRAWHNAGGLPKPDHPKLLNYNTRRTRHLLKLCMVSCASSREDYMITLECYQEAMEWLVEAETSMPDIFKAMNSGGDGKVMDECWFFCYRYRMKMKAPIPESYVIRFLQEKVPSHNIERIIDIMIKSKMLKRKAIPTKGTHYEAADPNQERGY